MGPNETNDRPGLAMGAFLPTMTAPGEPMPDISAIARRAEEHGLESVWVVDQLIAGTGAPFIESVVALAATAAVTTRVKLGFGVMITPLRSPAWLAKQIGSLQHISGDRVLLGVGAGGDRHDRSWTAVGVPRTRRGARIDETLAALPDLLPGRSVEVAARLPINVRGAIESGDQAVRLAPASTMPPLLVGGMSDAAIRRAVDHDAEWFLLPLSPDDVRAARDRAMAIADERDRPAPAITTGMLIALDDDPSLPDIAGIEQRLTDPDGMFGMPLDAARTMLVRGDVEQVARRLVAVHDAGASRVVASIAAGDPDRQIELFAEAGRLAASRIS